MKVTFWGTRGSIPTFGPDTQKYGGNTPCVTVSHKDTLLILDAGSGIRNLGESSLPVKFRKVHILLTHLHMDHIQGLGFFGPFFNPNAEIHLWGPSGSTMSLHKRLSQYLSPPLFPIRMRDFNCEFHVHELPLKNLNIGPFKILIDYVCHPGPTVGFRITQSKCILTYIPDHEPALGVAEFPNEPEWTSGYSLSEGAHLLIHDAQFSSEEYELRNGWGHSSIKDTLKLAELAGVRSLSLFHHDPSHTDAQLEMWFTQLNLSQYPYDVAYAIESETIELL